jgi:hypothetical protein
VYTIHQIYIVVAILVREKAKKKKEKEKEKEKENPADTPPRRGIGVKCPPLLIQI